MNANNSLKLALKTLKSVFRFDLYMRPRIGHKSLCKWVYSRWCQWVFVFPGLFTTHCYRKKLPAVEIYDSADPVAVGRPPSSEVTAPTIMSSDAVVQWKSARDRATRTRWCSEGVLGIIVPAGRNGAVKEC